MEIKILFDEKREQVTHILFSIAIRVQIILKVKMYDQAHITVSKCFDLMFTTTPKNDGRQGNNIFCIE